MSRRSPCFLLAVTLGAGAVSLASPRNPGNTAVSVKVSHEMAAPGGMAQMKIRMTDAKPIITGRARMSFSGFSSIEGINLVSPGDDAAGVAVVSGTDVAISVVSPNGLFGTDSDYPLITVVGRVPADAPLGATFPMTIDGDSLRLLDPSGVAYATETDSGQLVSSPSLAVHDVVPGSALLPPGGLVTIHGNYFQRHTEVRFKEMSIAQVVPVSATRMDVVVAEDTPMHGLEIEVRNPDGARVEYFSYQRTSRAGKTGHSALRDVVPIFRNRTMQSATLHLSGATTGVALQNLAKSDAVVVAELFTATGLAVAATTVTVPSNRFVVRSLSELFRTRTATQHIVRVTSAIPVQVLGVSVDAAGVATPQLPQ